MLYIILPMPNEGSITPGTKFLPDTCAPQACSKMICQVHHQLTPGTGLLPDSHLHVRGSKVKHVAAVKDSYSMGCLEAKYTT